MKNNKTIIIAEIGINHNGNIKLAKDMISRATKAGADFVKIQLYKTESLVTKNALKANYQKNKFESNKQFQMLKKYEVSLSIFYELKKFCKKINANLLVSPFDLSSIELLRKNNFKYIKIPSGEITNYPYICKIGKLKSKVFLSTGMATFFEIEQCIEILIKNGTLKKNITILHCTSSYPTNYEDVNLNIINEMKKRFNSNIGYSDHTKGYEVAIAAVSLGAKIIEKHFTLDRALDGPDQFTSLEPIEFENMVKKIRNIEIALGSKLKKPTKSELKNIKYVRKSIYANRDIKKGEKFTSKNIITKRPAKGLSAMEWPKLINKKAKKYYKKDQLIK